MMVKEGCCSRMRQLVMRRYSRMGAEGGELLWNEGEGGLLF
jgi:hypothetical protein